MPGGGAPFRGTLGYRSRCSLCASLAVFHIEMKIILNTDAPKGLSGRAGRRQKTRFRFSGIVLGE